MKDREIREGQFAKVGEPNKVNDEMMLKIKEVVIKICLAAAVISRKTVIQLKQGYWKQTTLIHCQNLEEIYTDWVRGILKSMDWVKRKGTTGNNF